MFDQNVGLCRGGRLQTCEHSESTILTWVFAPTASAACPAHLGSLAMASISFFGRHLRCRRTLLCEQCIRAGIVFHLKRMGNYSPRRDGYRYGETITFTLNDCDADRSTEVGRHSCRRLRRQGILVIHCLKDNDPNTTTLRCSSRNR